MARKSRIRAYSPRNAREREEQLDALAALALMRREALPASLAGKAEGISVRKIKKYVGPALKKRGKDFVAKPTDRLLRPPMLILTSKGVRAVEVRSSKAASLIGRYWNAVDDALKGKRSALKEFQGKTIRGTQLKFLTNPKTLHQLQDAGELGNIKEIYWHGRRR